MVRDEDSDPHLRNMKLLAKFMIGVSLVFLAGFAGYSWVTEREYVIGKLSSILRYSTQYCETYFSRVEKQHRILGAELLHAHRQVSAGQAITMLNNYKGINHDQKWFALLAGNGDLIAETDTDLNEQRPYYLSEIPSRKVPEDVLVNERLEFEPPGKGILDDGLVMPFRYAVRGSSGEVRYVVRSRLRVGLLQEMWRMSLIPQESTLGFIHDDGYLINRYSANPGVVSANEFGNAEAATLSRYIKTGGFPLEGYVTINHDATGSQSLVVYKRLIQYPVTAFVSIPVSFVTTGWWTRTRVPLLMAVLVLAGGLAIYRLMLKKHQAERLFSRKQAELQDVAQGILVAQERERARISHELHDEIGQSLTALKITLNRARQSLGDRGKIEALLSSGQQMVEEMVGGVRELAYRLRPSELDQLGLAAALRSHLDKMVRPVFQEVKLTENVGHRRFSRDLELCCFRVAQEALTNCLRHAKATRVDVSLSFDASRLELAIRDDGVGFDVAQYHSAQISPGALGLVGMRERVTVNGGQLLIQALPAGGTEVKALFKAVEEV